MATGTSIVGSWQLYVSWGCAGNAAMASVCTFNPDGSWSFPGGGGRWIQVEGMVTFSFSNVPSLSYSANVTRNACVGIMAFTNPPPTQVPGCFYMIRSGSPGGPAAAAAALTADSSAARTPGSDAGPPAEFDLLFGPPPRK